MVAKAAGKDLSFICWLQNITYIFSGKVTRTEQYCFLSFRSCAPDKTLWVKNTPPPPSPLSEKIDQSDSFLAISKAGQINENINVTKYGNKLKTSYPKILLLLRLTSGG